MEYEKQLIWIIPNNEYSENNLEDGRELLEEKYNHSPSFLGIRVLPSAPLDYRNNGFRDLQIESIIENVKIDDAIELLYREIDSQKENLKRKSL